MSIKDGGPVMVPLINGGFALISQEDSERVLLHQWRSTKVGYVMRKGGNSTSISLHRFVLDAPVGIDVHHKNECKSDCRRDNLEAMTPAAHQSMHSHLVIARNVASRVYDTEGKCKACGKLYAKHPDHRGRQVCCSKLCAIWLAISARKESRMLRAREAGQ